MIYPIVRYGNPVLERPTEPVTDFDTPQLHQFIEEMFQSMYAAKGVGLAAPQIGFARRIAVIDISVGEDPEQKIVLINPQIIRAEGDIVNGQVAGEVASPRQDEGIVAAALALQVVGGQ